MWYKAPIGLCLYTWLRGCDNILKVIFVNWDASGCMISITTRSWTDWKYSRRSLTFCLTRRTNRTRLTCAENQRTISPKKREKKNFFTTPVISVSPILWLCSGVTGRSPGLRKKTVPIFLKCSLSEIRSEIKGQPAQYCQGLTLS